MHYYELLRLGELKTTASSTLADKLACSGHREHPNNMQGHNACALVESSRRCLVRVACMVVFNVNVSMKASSIISLMRLLQPAILHAGLAGLV